MSAVIQVFSLWLQGQAQQEAKRQYVEQTAIQEQIRAEEKKRYEEQLVLQEKALDIQEEMRDLAHTQYTEERAMQEAEIESTIEQYRYNAAQLATDVEQLYRERESELGILEEEQAFFRRHQRAALGASGAVMGTGTSLRTQLETVERQEADVKSVWWKYATDIRKKEEEIKYTEEELERWETVLSEQFGEGGGNGGGWGSWGNWFK